MKNIKLKVCGMRDPNNILEVLDLQPDFMGFIFYRNSPRFVGDDFVVPVLTGSATKKVGVFVDERTDVIMSGLTDLSMFSYTGMKPPMNVAS
jgi:phosphoribosylanthranilate isomerase